MCTAGSPLIVDAWSQSCCCRTSPLDWAVELELQISHSETSKLEDHVSTCNFCWYICSSIEMMEKPAAVQQVRQRGIHQSLSSAAALHPAQSSIFRRITKSFQLQKNPLLPDNREKYFHRLLKFVILQFPLISLLLLTPSTPFLSPICLLFSTEPPPLPPLPSLKQSCWRGS